MEKRLNALLRLAISHHATDIHFTLYQNEMVIEMRINNAIRKVKIQNGDDKLIKYLQYLSNLDIGNIKIPQAESVAVIKKRLQSINKVHYTAPQKVMK